MLNRLRFLIFLLLTTPSICFSQNDLVYPKQDQVLAQTEILFTWSLESNVNDYLIEVSTDPSFSLLAFSQLVTNDNQITSSPLIENETYYWRIQYDGSIYSSIGSFNIVNYGIHPDVEFWLDPSDVLINSGDRVETWIDQTANFTFTQPEINEMPYYISEFQFFNNLPAIEFRINEDNNIGNINISTLTEGEIFAVKKLNNYPAINSQNSGLWQFGSATSSDHYPFTDGNVYSGFGRNTRFNIGNHSGSVDFTQPHLTNISSSSDFNYRINAQEYFSSSAGNVSFSQNCKLGISVAEHRFYGYFGDILLFNKELSTAERSLAQGFIKDKYTAPLNLGTNLFLYSFCDTTLSAGTRFETYLWSTGETTESITVNESGNYWVQVTDIFGFESTDTVVVTYPEPDLPQFALYCPDSVYTWNANLGPDYDYLWSTGETTESIEINTPDTYGVTITDTNGCVYNSPNFDFIEDTLQQSISLGPDVELCSGNQIGLLEGEVNIVSYQWSTGENTPTITVQTTDEYILDVINAAGCPASDSVQVDIIGIAPDMEIDFPEIQCVGVEFNYEDLSETLDNSNIISWNWDFGDGGVGSDEIGTHTYNTVGNYTVFLEIDTDAGCGNSISQQVEVVANPVIGLTTQGFCEKQEILFNANQSTPTLIPNWSWDFGDPTSSGANGINTNHVYDDFGEYAVTLTATDVNGCQSSAMQLVDVRPTPVPAFSFSEVCVGGVVDFVNEASIVGSASISSQQWNFGDGTFSSQFEPSKSYAIHGDYLINFIVNGSNGCSADSSRNLKIHAYPQNAIDYAVFCAGIESDLSDNSFIPSGSVAQVFWNFGDGQELQGFTVPYEFNTPGNKEVIHRVVSAFGCENTETFEVSVNDFLSASFEFNPQAFLAGFPILFESTAVGADSLFWTVGQDTIFNSNSFQYIFDDSLINQNMDVTLWVTNDEGCVDEFTEDLPVLERVTDLAIKQIFLQENGPFFTVGVQIKNEGTTPILKADLLLRSNTNFSVSESWEGNLQAGESENFIFSTKISSAKNQNDDRENYVCVEGILNSQFGFEDIDLSNNEKCIFPFDDEESDVLITPFPNPIDQELTIQIILTTDEVIDLSIYDALGRKVKELATNQSFAQGLNSFSVDASSWSAGAYTIFLNTSKKSIAKKVIKH